MPRYRQEITALTQYEVGRPIEEVVREYGIEPEQVVKLTANESPVGPFPGVLEAASQALAMSNRYPDNAAWDLSGALAEELGVDRSNLLFGTGSTGLLADLANVLGGPGTSVVYGWPSFVMYRFSAVWAGSASIEVPTLDDFSLDLEAMASAIDDSTTLVFVCNPNNPTGTIKSGDEIDVFIDSVPDSVMIVIDEAYHDFVLDPRYRTAIPRALERDNVVVLRTFSKIYALAGHRIGYAVARDTTVTEVRKVQPPLVVGRVAQAAALASLGQPDEVNRRVEANAAGRHHLQGALTERGLLQAESHTNFVFFKMPGEDSRATSDAFTRQGVLIRPMSAGWMRVSVGTSTENRRFIEALDVVLRG